MSSAIVGIESAWDLVRAASARWWDGALSQVEEMGILHGECFQEAFFLIAHP